MKIKELIELLKELDQEAIVITNGHSDGSRYVLVNEHDIETLSVARGRPNWAGDHDQNFVPDAPDAFDAVRIG